MNKREKIVALYITVRQGVWQLKKLGSSSLSLNEKNKQLGSLCCVFRFKKFKLVLLLLQDAGGSFIIIL